MPKHLKGYRDHQPRQGKLRAEWCGGQWRSARADMENAARFHIGR